MTPKANVLWDDYVPSDAGLGMPPALVPRRQANEAFDQLMDEKEERKDVLTRLLQREGCRLTSSDVAIRKLEHWFTSHVEGDPDHAERLKPIWYGVITDIALFLGDVMIERRPELFWQLYTRDKRNVHYHWPAVMGFVDSADAVTPQQSLAVVGHRAVVALPIRHDSLLHLINYRR